LRITYTALAGRVSRLGTGAGERMLKVLIIFTGRGRKSGQSITFFTGENHERSLAGELARVVRESGFDIEPLKKFPMTIRKKTHSVYGAFYRDDVDMPNAPTKIVF
jgi:ATP-dependent RNA helicase DBP3